MADIDTLWKYCILESDFLPLSDFLNSDILVLIKTFFMAYMTSVCIATHFYISIKRFLAKNVGCLFS